MPRPCSKTKLHPITVLANPGHGNGPTVALLLAAEAFAQVAARPVTLILPDLTFLDGGRQAAVIRNRRDPASPLRVFFHRPLGDLLVRVTLQNNDFAANVRDIAEHQPAVQAAAQALIAAGLRDLRELLPDGRETPAGAEFAADAIDFELAHGSRIRFLPTARAYAFFPCLLSDLLRTVQGEGAAGENPALTVALRHAVALEEGYRRIFLPALHTFTWDADWQAAANVEFTPFPRPAPAAYHGAGPLPAGPGIYLMVSGCGRAGDESIVSLAARLLAAAEEKLVVYVPPGGFPAALLARLPRVHELNAAHIPHPDIRLVVGRAGWGTLWECMNAGKLFVAIPPLPGDDPEISLNLRTLAATGLAITETGSAAACLARIPEVQARIADTLAAFRRAFGTIDGLAAMARRILGYPILGYPAWPSGPS
jgi:hypothetical protein